MRSQLRRSLRAPTDAVPAIGGTLRRGWRCRRLGQVGLSVEPVAALEFCAQHSFGEVEVSVAAVGRLGLA